MDASLPLGTGFNADPKLQRQQLKLDTLHLLGQGAGLRYIARLISLSGALGASYAASSSHATAYNEGLRRMGLFILADVQENTPDLLPKLLLLCLPKKSTAPPEQNKTD